MVSLSVIMNQELTNYASNYTPRQCWRVIRGCGDNASRLRQPSGDRCGSGPPFEIVYSRRATLPVTLPATARNHPVLLPKTQDASYHKYFCLLWVILVLEERTQTRPISSTRSRRQIAADREDKRRRGICHLS